MNLTRRHFLKASGIVAASVAIPGFANAGTDLGFLVSAQAIDWRFQDATRKKALEGTYKHPSSNTLNVSSELKRIGRQEVQGRNPYPHKVLDDFILVTERRFAGTCPSHPDGVQNLPGATNFIRLYGNFRIYPVQPGAVGITFDGGISECLNVNPGDVVLTFINKQDGAWVIPHGYKRNPLHYQGAPIDVKCAHDDPDGSITESIYVVGAEWWGDSRGNVNNAMPSVARPLHPAWRGRRSKMGKYATNEFKDQHEAQQAVKEMFMLAALNDSSFIRRAGNLRSPAVCESETQEERDAEYHRRVNSETNY
jgi:hypothetical protein